MKGSLFRVSRGTATLEKESVLRLREGSTNPPLDELFVFNRPMTPIYPFGIFLELMSIWSSEKSTSCHIDPLLWSTSVKRSRQTMARRRKFQSYELFYIEYIYFFILNILIQFFNITLRSRFLSEA